MERQIRINVWSIQMVLFKSFLLQNKKAYPAMIEIRSKKSEFCLKFGLK